jgi:hypothetical protein
MDQRMDFSILTELRAHAASYLQMGHMAAEQYVKYLLGFDPENAAIEYGPVVLLLVEGTDACEGPGQSHLITPQLP